MSDRTHPDSGPVTPGEAGFTAADMATAAAQGFRDGVASVAASAGSEPVAQPGDAEAILSKICDLFHIGKLARTESTILTNIRNVIDHAGLLHAVERDLFPHPELPEDDDPYAAVDEGPPAPNSWAAKSEADYVAQFRAALAARGFTHPSPPEGMVGGWISVEERLPKCSRKPDSLGVEVLIWPPHEDGSRTAFYGRRQSQNPNFYKYGALLGHVGFWQYPPAPPTTSAGSGKGE